MDTGNETVDYCSCNRRARRSGRRAVRALARKLGRCQTCGKLKRPFEYAGISKPFWYEQEKWETHAKNYGLVRSVSMPRSAVLKRWPR